MSNDLERLETWATPLLNKLSAGERRNLARKIAIALRRSQQRRIKKQQNVDGSQYEPRKRPRPKKNKPIRFYYEGTGRVAELKSYVKRGDSYTGFDIEADDIRTFRKDRIGRFFTPTVSAGGTVRQKQGRIKNKLFQRMSANRYMKIKATDAGFDLGFFGEVARIARVHQYGLHDQVAPGGPDVRYEQRQLLGFTAEDTQMVQDMLMEHLL